MPAVGHHATKCTICGRNTYRASGICRKCESERTLNPGEFSEAMLLACAAELRRRHLAREEALRAIGVLPPKETA